ncbi:MAG: hypothetical protein ABJA89_10555 [Lapillicoccus sp.]
MLTASPALAAPPTPAGCSFDRGTLTCVTTVSGPTTTEGPFSTNGFVTAATLTDGFTGTQVCDIVFGHPHPDLGSYQVVGGLFSVRTDTVTTTTQRGVSGKSPVLSSWTRQSRVLVSVQAGRTGCFNRDVLA